MSILRSVIMPARNISFGATLEMNANSSIAPEESHCESPRRDVGDAPPGSRGSNLTAGPQTRIAELDGLRAFAVLAVIAFHMTYAARSIPEPPAAFGPLMQQLGANGVNVFFAISGYIITTLLRREDALRGRVSLRGFYIRRGARILPPFAVYLVVLIALHFWLNFPLSRRNVIFSAFFLGNTPLIGQNGWFVAHTWSLAVEEQFYLLLPPLMCLAGVRKRLGLALVGALFLFSVHFLPLWQALAPFTPFRYILAGVLLALAGEHVLPRLAGTSRLVPLALAVAVFAAQIYPILHKLPNLLISTLEPLAIALFVGWFIQNPSKCAVLRLRGMQWMGACSYSIYLWQQLFTGPARFYPVHGLIEFAWLSIPLTLLCAAASHYLIEQPCVALGRRFQNRFAPRTVTPPPVPSLNLPRLDPALPRS